MTSLQTHDGVDNATLALFASWRLEDATDDPCEILAAEREVAEFKDAMKWNRVNSGEPSL